MCGLDLIKEIEFVDLIEAEKITKAHILNDNEIEFSIKPFEIVTLKIRM